MKNFRNLRKLMIQNGMIASVEGRAGSLRIVPIGAPLFADKPPDDPVEGGGCGSCSIGCIGGCDDGCMNGCSFGSMYGCDLSSTS